jgi:serine/threonine protein kinase
MTTYASLHLSDSEILESCRSTPSFSGFVYGIQLVKISELVVKFGVGLKRQEADNQEFARRNVDATVLYIPKVYRFFEAQLSGATMGFIVMDYVAGKSLDTLDISTDPSLASHTVRAIQHLETIPPPPGQGPGPVGGGSAQGYLWSGSGSGSSFCTVEDMESWMNTRLAAVKQPTISLANHQRLRLRHMDLVRRNILLCPDLSICFVDWAFAGFYPAIFETHVFRDLIHTDKVWFTQLLELSEKPGAEDEQLLRYLGVPAFVNEKY